MHVLQVGFARVKPSLGGTWISFNAFCWFSSPWRKMHRDSSQWFLASLDWTLFEDWWLVPCNVRFLLGKYILDKTYKFDMSLCYLNPPCMTNLKTEPLKEKKGIWWYFASDRRKKWNFAVSFWMFYFFPYDLEFGFLRLRCVYGNWFFQMDIFPLIKQAKLFAHKPTYFFLKAHKIRSLCFLPLVATGK